MPDRCRKLLRELRIAIPWPAFCSGLLLATQPVWASVLFGVQLSADDFLPIRCFSFPP